MAEAAIVFEAVKLLVITSNFCFQIIRRAYDAPNEIKKLNAEASNWRPQLESLAELLEGDNPTTTDLRECLQDGCLLQVNNLIEELNSILEPYQKPSRLKKFQWTFAKERDRVAELLSRLQSNMGTIMNHLHIHNSKMLSWMRTEIEKIQLQGINEPERRNILEWLKPKGIDCDEFHRLKRDLQVEGTCDWLAESWPWIDWCVGGSPISSRFLWIHGIAGAGKTVLASYAIDQVLTQYQHKGVSYYYCSHERNKRGHTSSEEACSFLRWVIRDLTSQVSRPKSRKINQQASIPKALEDLYVRHDFSVQRLLDCLLSVTQHIAREFEQQVCIIIDAVDESPSPRDALLNILTTIGTDPIWQHVSICFTSRKEKDISEAIEAIQPAQPDYSAQLAHLTQQARRGQIKDRDILVPVGPSSRWRTRENEAGATTTAGFDGRSPFSNDMPPPPQPANTWQRGRTPSGVTYDPLNPSHRTSRSERRHPSGHTTSRLSGQERSTSTFPVDASRGGDAMDIDSDDQFVPRRCAEGCTILSMDDNPDVRQAICTFVRKQMLDRRPLKSDDNDIEAIITLIANKAKGMFRWAACQVNIIIHDNLRDMESITRMLEKMPTDIFGTYEHMIMKLLPGTHGQNEHNRNFARTALALLCSPTAGISCAEVLVEASRFMVPSAFELDYDLEQLESILGCLITVTDLARRPESMYTRTKEEPNAKKQVSVAHYTVKEYLFDEKTASGEVKDFAFSKEAIQNLELQVIFRGLQQYSVNKAERYPTRYEEYCLKMTDKALKERRDLIVRDKTIWNTVTKCLRWNSSHHLPKSGAFPNLRIRASLSNWAKTSPFEQGQEPDHPETSILVSLLLLQWPELAVVYLADLPEAKKKDIWKDQFELAKSFKVEGTEPTTLMQMCVTRRDIDFLEALIESRADFSGEIDLVMDLFFHAYGHRSLNDEDGGAKTGSMLKMLLDRGVRPETRGYIFTPLQYAVSNLEDRWVHDLLKEGADPNATGRPDGVDPFGQKSDISWELTPLQICKVTTPSWFQSVDGGKHEDLMNQSRLKVQVELRQFGARDEEDLVDTIEIDSD